MISPVGLEKDRILTGFKRFGITHLYLIQSEKKNKDNNEKRLADTVRNFANDLKEKLIKIFEENLKLKNANITDLEDCMRILNAIIKYELKKGATKIYINISTSSKIFAIATIYLAGLNPNLIIPFYAKTSNYLVQDFIEILTDETKLDNREKCFAELKKIKGNFYESGWTTGKYVIKLIPALPFKKFTQFQEQIFKKLIVGKSEKKLNDMVEEFENNKLKERSVRSKISYALHDLIEYGLIEKIRRGKFIYLKLTEIGEIFGNYLIISS